MLSVFCRFPSDDCNCAPLIINDPLHHLRAETITLNDCNFMEDCLGLKRQL